jgi:hypothetical protein
MKIENQRIKDVQKIKDSLKQVNHNKKCANLLGRWRVVIMLKSLNFAFLNFTRKTKNLFK